MSTDETASGPIDWSSVDAVLFDLDGVITPTAEVHMNAWAEMFKPFLEEKGVAAYSDEDYFAHVDGRPRYEGVAELLKARDIDLPWGDPSDPSDQESGEETVCGLGNRKNDLFGEVLARDGVSAYPGSVQLLDALDERGIHMAIVSSSANAPDVLRTAGILERFGTVVDGAVAKKRELPGKPKPDTYEFAADELDVPHNRSVVVEDAVSGVQAGAAGDFAYVIGVDRGAGADTLRSNGADVVVDDLGELVDDVRDGAR